MPSIAPANTTSVFGAQDADAAERELAAGADRDFHGHADARSSAQRAFHLERQLRRRPSRENSLGCDNARWIQMRAAFYAGQRPLAADRAQIETANRLKDAPINSRADAQSLYHQTRELAAGSADPAVQKTALAVMDRISKYLLSSIPSHPVETVQPGMARLARGNTLKRRVQQEQALLHMLQQKLSYTRRVLQTCSVVAIGPGFETPAMLEHRVTASRARLVVFQNDLQNWADEPGISQPASQMPVFRGSLAQE